MTNAIAPRVLEFARAQRLAQVLSNAGKPVPAHVTNIIASGENLYANLARNAAHSPADRQALQAIDSHLAAARSQIDIDIYQAKTQADEQRRAADAEFRETQFQRAMGNGLGEKQVKQIAAGEKAIPHTTYKTDARGNREKINETRKPSNAEQRRAQLILAAEKHGFGNELAGDLNGKRIQELREAEEKVAYTGVKTNRRIDLLNAMDAHDAIAYDTDANTPDVSYADPGESSRETVTRSWSDLDTSTPNESQETAQTWHFSIRTRTRPAPSRTSTA